MPTSTERDRSPGLAYLTARHLYRTLAYTPLYVVGMGGLTAGLSLLVLVNPSSRFSSYLLLTLAGWSLYLGQLHATDQLGDDSDPDRSRFTELLVSAVSVVYYHAVMFFAAVGGIAAEAAGFPNVAVTVAFLGPVADLEGSRQYGIGLLALVYTVTVAVGERSTEAYEGSVAEAVDESVVAFLALGKDAVPPALGRLSLRTFAAERYGRRRDY
jgi:hypothetical protein